MASLPSPTTTDSPSSKLYAGRGETTATTIEIVPTTTAVSSSARYSALQQHESEQKSRKRKFPLFSSEHFALSDLKSKENILKIEQLVFSIVAIICAVGGGCCTRSPFLIGIFCDTDAGTFVQYQYPYRMHRTHIESCKPNCPLTRIDRTSSSAQMFVFTAVLSMLFSAGAIFVFFWQRHQSGERIDARAIKSFNKRWPQAFVIGQAFLALMWFSTSVAWSVGVSEIRALTSESYVQGIMQSESEKFINCMIRADSNGILVWSILTGFVTTIICLLSAIDGMNKCKFSILNKEKQQSSYKDSEQEQQTSPGKNIEIQTTTQGPVV